MDLVIRSYHRLRNLFRTVYGSFIVPVKKKRETATVGFAIGCPELVPFGGGEATSYRLRVNASVNIKKTLRSSFFIAGKRSGVNLENTHYG